MHIDVCSPVIHVDHDEHLSYMIYNILTPLLLQLCMVCYPNTCDILSDIILDFIVDILISVSFIFLIQYIILQYHSMLTRDMHVYIPSFYTLIVSFLTPLDLHIQLYAYSILLIRYLKGSHILRGAQTYSFDLLI